MMSVTRVLESLVLKLKLQISNVCAGKYWLETGMPALQAVDVSDA